MLKPADTVIGVIVATCDKCGAVTEVNALEFKEANAKIKPLGWICFYDQQAGKFKNHCPKCSGAVLTPSPAQAVKMRKSVLAQVQEYVDGRIKSCQGFYMTLENEHLLPGVPKKDTEIEEMKHRADELLRVKKTIDNLIRQNEYLTQRAVRKRKQNQAEGGGE